MNEKLTDIDKHQTNKTTKNTKQPVISSAKIANKNDAISSQQMQKITQLLAQSNIQEAINFCNNLLIKLPAAAEIYNILGIIAAQINNIQQSINYFHKAIYYEPKEAVYHNNLSNALKKQGNLHQARQHLHQALMLSPNYAEAYNNLGSLYYTEGRIKEAMPCFKKAIRLFPNYWEAHYNLANSLVKEELLTNAIEHYKTTLAIKPDHVTAQQNLAMTYIATNQLMTALPYLENVIQYNPNHAELHAQLAEVYLEIGKTTEAINFLEKALAISPKQAVWHHNLAILYLRQQQTKQALLHFKESLTYEPNNQTATHMVNALSTNTIQNAPLKYVADLFDQYAQFYNLHMKEQLHYKVPELLRQTVGHFLKDNLNTMNILDLGCGTGLCSIYFRDLAQYLIGIDLSINMLTQAKLINAYDALCCGNILQAIPGENIAFFDLIIAADVLVYCGELANVFQLCYKALKTHGLFAFTVELLEHGEYQLQKTGRFAHADNYILAITKKYNFTVNIQKQITLRMNNNQPIMGMLYLLTKQP